MSDLDHLKSSYGVVVSSESLTKEKDRPAGLVGLPDSEYEEIMERYSVCFVNSLGEGQINVCSEGGDFEVGDPICTSESLGKGMRYDGQDTRYVVAKCMEPVSWSEEDSDVKMVACVYLCG